MTLWSEKILDTNSIFLNYWVLICGLRCGTSSRMFHMQLRRKCALLHLERKSWSYQLGPFGLIVYLRFLFLINFLFWWSVIGIWGVLKSLTIIMLLLCLLVFALCIKVLLCWVHTYLHLLYHLLGLTPWLLCTVFLCLSQYYLF